MLSLPAAIIAILAPFVPLFDVRTWRNALVLVVEPDGSLVQHPDPGRALAPELYATNPRQVCQAIHRFTDARNEHPVPFVWTENVG